MPPHDAMPQHAMLRLRTRAVAEMLKRINPTTSLNYPFKLLKCTVLRSRRGNSGYKRRVQKSEWPEFWGMKAERYRAAPTFEEYLATVEKNRDLWLSASARADVEEAVVEAARAAGVWRLAALNEDWCGDAFNTLPYLAKLVSLSPNLELRVFGRDANPDLMDAHLTKGARSIPVVIVYDAAMQERGWWGPRPSPLQDWFERIGRGMPASERYRDSRRWYVVDRGRTALREITALLTQSSVIGAEGLPKRPGRDAAPAGSHERGAGPGEAGFVQAGSASGDASRIGCDR
jgi:hypothetical protein